MTTTEFNANQANAIVIGDEFTEFSDITFEQGSGIEGQEALTTLVISYGEDKIVVDNYFVKTTIDGVDSYDMAVGAVNTFNVGGKDYTLEWKKSNVFAEGSAYAGNNASYGDGGAMYNIVDGSANSETINSVEGIRNWINGGEGRQTINGKNEFDMLAGNEDNDTINASYYNPTEIYGGLGDDTLTGSVEADWISGNEGNDKIYGGVGDDWLFGGDHTSEADPNGKDVIYGEDGDDNIYGRGGDDKLYGGSGNDSIYAGNGNDYIEGNKGNDILTGGSGSDTFVFSKGDGIDSIVDAVSSDAIKFNKSIAYKNISFEQGNGDRPDEPITSLIIKYNDGDKINVENFFTALNTPAADVVTKFNIEGKDYNLEWRQLGQTGEYGMYNVINAQDYVSPNGTSGIKINSKTGNENIVGSMYNDTIKIKGGDNNIVETAGINKITLGKGDDVVEVSGYSSNTIKAGEGDNYITLDSIGSNKVTTGKGDDIVDILSGANNLNLGNGENIVTIGDTTRATYLSINTIKTGKHDDSFTIYDGNNNIKSSSGDDSFMISGGYNTINSGNGENILHLTDGVNKITSGKNQDTYMILDGLNTVNSGKGNDIFDISGGSNFLNGDSGVDIFNVSDSGILSNDSATLQIAKLNGGAGNDIYKIDESAYQNNLIDITDKSGKNSLVVDKQLDVYFDVKLGKKGKYSTGKQVIFTDGFDSNGDGEYDVDSLKTGISVTGKNAKAIANVTVETQGVGTKYSFNVASLANDVAGWLSTNGFKSSSAVLASGDDAAINNLLGVYAGTTNYTGSDQCYRNAVAV